MRGYRWENIVELWNDWYINDDKTFTKANNLRSPRYAKVIDWIALAWSELDPEIIKSSLKWFDITTKLTGEHHSALRQMMIDPVEDFVVETIDYQDERELFNGTMSTEEEDVDGGGQ